MKSRELLFDLNFKKVNINTISDDKEIILSASELNELCYEITIEINRLEQNLNSYSLMTSKDNSLFIKILYQTQKTSQLLKLAYNTITNSFMLGLIFSNKEQNELESLYKDFNLSEQTEKFNSIKNQISVLSYDNYQNVF